MKENRRFLNEIYSEKFLSNWITPHTIFTSRRKINLKIENLFDIAIKNLNKEIVEVTDVGCYYGATIYYFLNKYAKKKILFYGIDIDDKKIDYAKKILKRVKEKKFRERVSFSKHNIEKTNLQHSSDIILCIETIEHVHNVLRSLQHMNNSLRKGGYLIISTPNKNNTLKYFIPFRKKTKMRIEEPDKIKGGDAISGNLFNFHVVEKEEDKHWSVMTLEEIKTLLKKTGFNIIKIQRGPLVYGGSFFDNHPLLTSLLNVFDELLTIFHVGKRTTYDFIIFAQK